MPELIRPATSDDIPAITEIYAEAVTSGTASFELTVPDESEMAARFSALTTAGYPYLAFENDSELLGYAYAGAYRARPAYRWCLENSIYMAPGARGRGYGRMLLRELIGASAARGFRQMLAVIGDTDNAASIALHRACGFAHVGTFRDVGWKHGRWLDTVLMQLPLGKGAASPPEEESLPGKLYRPPKPT